MRFRAQLDLIATADGGRTTPATLDWRPAFHVESVQTSTSMFLDSVEPPGPLLPGQSYLVRAELLSPEFFAGKLLPNVRFGLYEGSRRVADGVIIEVA